MRQIRIERGRHYRRDFKPIQPYGRICAFLDNAAVRLTGRHSRFRMYLKMYMLRSEPEQRTLGAWKNLKSTSNHEYK